jgi:Flp pilus assembly protein TadD
MGEIEIKRGKTTEGISHFKNALKKFPKNILIRSRLGEIYASEKEYSDAEKYFKGALKFAPRNPYLLNNLGYIYIMKDNNFEEGIALIRKADRLRPNNGYIKESLGWALYRFGKYEEALKTLEQAHSLLGSTPRLLSHLEDTYKALNMPDKVQEIQKLAEQLKENDGDNDSE